MTGRNETDRIRLQFHRRLTADTVERVFRGASPATKTAGGWTDRAKQKGMFIDLSKVEFAEFNSLAQIALLIEGAVRHGISVVVALPLKRTRIGEQRFMDACDESGETSKKSLIKGVQKRIEQRGRSWDFMLHAGFFDAIKVQHVPESHKLVEILTEYDSSSRETEAALPQGELPSSQDKEAEASWQEYYKLSRIYPLRWFEPLDGVQLEQSRNFASFVVHCEDLGLAASDARAIAGTILKELVENTCRHALEPELPSENKPHALVGMIVLDPEKYRIRPEDMRPCMSDFADWCREIRSRIIRIVVGDSGNGVPTVLGPHFKSMYDKQIPSFSEDEPLRDTEKILFWSFNKWSTSDLKSSLEKRGTRGLWLVQRFVRIYGGSITMRAEDGMVGWTYQDSEMPTAVRDKRLRYMPGTLLEACLLSENRKPRRGTSTKKREAEPPYFGLTTLRCHTLTDKGFEIRDVSAITSALAEATPTKPACVLGMIEGVRSNVRATEDVLIDAIYSMENFPNHGALVFLLADVAFEQVMTASESIDQAREDLDEEQLQGTDTPLSIEPILLLGPRGDSVWFGGDSTVRAILSLLSERERDDSKGIPFDDLCYGSITVEALERFVRDQTDLIQRIGSSAVRLRFTPSQLSRLLSTSFAKQLKDAIDEGTTEAIQVGVFITPSLVPVNRWIDVTALLDKTTGIGPAAYVLARKVEDRLAHIGVYPAGYSAKLVRVDKASAEIADALSECLGLDCSRYAIPGGIEAYTHAEAISVRPGDEVVLCADLMLTGGTVKRAISDLLRLGAHPIAAVCVIDARREKLGSIRDVPVVSLAETNIISLPPKDSHSVQYIDPVLREPSVEAPWTTIGPGKYPLEPEFILEWCETIGQSSALVFGHIVREVGRHFPVYLDADQFVTKDLQHRKTILACFTHQAVLWIQEQHKHKVELDEEPVKVVEIWYPGERNDFAERIAHGLAGELKAATTEVSQTVLRRIPRAACEGRWVFPDTTVPFRKRSHVLAVDWGSITTATIHQMMRLAGQAGASSFRALVFLSQMPVQEEVALRSITAIRSVEPAQTLGIRERGSGTDTPLFVAMEPVAREEKSVPARVSFLSSLRLRYYRPSDCPMCRMREASPSEETHWPTMLLAEHARKTAKRLEPRDRGDLFGRLQTDLYGVTLGPTEITDVVRTQHRLQAAIRSTHERTRIQTELDSLCEGESGDRRTRVTWLRVLATEPVWLKLPPLCFEHVRESVAKIALSVAKGKETKQFNAGERQQAVIVLRAASKEQFVASLPDLFPDYLGDETLVGQLLYDTFTYLRKSYHESSTILKGLRASLTKCRDYLRHSQHSGSLVLKCASTVSTLLRATEFLLTRQGTLDSSHKEAWRALREKYVMPLLSPHSFVENNLDVLLPLSCPVQADVLPDKRRWERACFAWENCLDFISSNVFPYLQRLRGVFLHEFYNVRFGSDIDRLQRLIDENIPYRVGDKLTWLLWEFAQSPESFRDVSKRSEANREWLWWYRLFLEAGGGKDSQPIGAKFLRLLEDCPANAIDAIETALARVTEKRYPFEQLKSFDKSSMPAHVFCDRRLLENVLTHVLENATGPKHRTEQIQMSLKNRVFLDVEPEPPTGMIVLRIWNDGTQPTSPPGHGLKAANCNLAAFGGTISGKVMTDGNWTYVVRITLEKWDEP